MFELKPSYDISRMMSKIAVELQGDFCYARSFDKEFVAKLMFEGFLIMAHQEGRKSFLLLPKLHQERCIMNLTELRVPKRIRAMALPFTFSVDKSFLAVLDGIQKQHGTGCWLYPPLADILHDFHKKPHGPIRVHSVEVWHGDKLVAGEIGVSMGACYTSYSGFSQEASSGTVQCVALGKHLAAMGFKLWDLGMGMAYKGRLGAQDVPRLMFLARLRMARDGAVAPLSCGPIHCALLFPPAASALKAKSDNVYDKTAKVLPQRDPNSKRQRKYQAKKARIAEYKAAKAAGKPITRPFEHVQHAGTESRPAHDIAEAQVQTIEF